MFHQTDDLRIDRLRPLLPPAILLEELPLTEHASEVVDEARLAAEALLRGDDDRLLVIVGPCSVHDVDAAKDYAARLAPIRERLKDDLLIIMRVYFEKPRTTVGWKGLINDPHLDGSFDINTGLRVARKLLVELNEFGMPAGVEFLDTISPQFIADLVAWGAIGARTTESQIHRELASGLSMPIGFKNGTGGSVQIAVDACGAAAHPHHFLSVTKQGLSAIVSTRGNEACHVILRGGSRGTNYDEASVQAAAELMEAQGLAPCLMIDCSHANSLKDHRNQPKVAASVAAQLKAGDKRICGVMLESHIVAGKQKYVPGEEATYGQSITDACMDISTTEGVLDELAAAVRARREACS